MKHCNECGEAGTRTNPVGTIHVPGRGMARSVHQVCGRRALEFAEHGDVYEINLRLWPTNRIDEEQGQPGYALLSQFAVLIKDLPDEQVAAYGGVEGRLLEVARGCVLPHMVALGTPGPASCTASEWAALCIEARQIWHDQRADAAALA